MGKYTLRNNEVIEAWQYTGTTFDAPKWAMDRMRDSTSHKPGDIWFDKFEKYPDDMRVQYGSAGFERYIVHGGDYLVLGEGDVITVVPKDEFEEKYCKVDDD